jgi:SMC interacting uncharacterized protein involved in chromosome segregation
MDENQLPPITDDLWKKSNINKLENEIAFLNRQIEDLKIQVHHKDIFIAKYVDNRLARVKSKLYNQEHMNYLILALVSFIAGMALIYII